jgi:hypothetical protein
MPTWNITYVPYAVLETNYTGSLLDHPEVKTATVSGIDYLYALHAFDPNTEMYVMGCERIAEETVANHGFADVGGMSYDEVRFASRGE